MRVLVSVLVMASVLLAASRSAEAQTSCKLCADQRQACMKNYAGPACSTEYKICMKSCKK